MRLVLFKRYFDKKMSNVEKKLRRPGIEPGTIAWKATMLTTTPPTHVL